MEILFAIIIVILCGVCWLARKRFLSRDSKRILDTQLQWQQHQVAMRQQAVKVHDLEEDLDIWP